jgi:hypothetical protein
MAKNNRDWKNGCYLGFPDSRQHADRVPGRGRRIFSPGHKKISLFGARESSQ